MAHRYGTTRMPTKSFLDERCNVAGRAANVDEAAVVKGQQRFAVAGGPTCPRLPGCWRLRARRPRFGDQNGVRLKAAEPRTGP